MVHVRMLRAKNEIENFKYTDSKLTKPHNYVINKIPQVQV